MQLNYLLDQAASSFGLDGTLRGRPGQGSKQGVAGLTRDIMTMQAEGDYAKAKELGDRLGVIRPPVQRCSTRWRRFRSTSSRDL